MVATSQTKQMIPPETQKLINDHVFNQGKIQEKKRILAEIDRLEAQSHATKTPIYQETMFRKIREIIAE